MIEKREVNSTKITGEALIQSIIEKSIELIILSSPALKGNQAVLSKPIITVSEEAYGSVIDVDTFTEAIRSLDISENNLHWFEVTFLTQLLY